MTDTDTLKQEAEYREQPDLKCCDTCDHADHYGGDIECPMLNNQFVSRTAICKHYTPYEEQK